MTSPVTVLGIAFCGTALICLLLVKQAQKRHGSRRWSSDGSGSDGGSYVGDVDPSHAHSHSHAFGHGGDHSGSGHSSDSGSSGDSGGDGGGGGDGGCWRRFTIALPQS
jgi:hypothetical protein